MKVEEYADPNKNSPGQQLDGKGSKKNREVVPPIASKNIKQLGRGQEAHMGAAYTDIVQKQHKGALIAMAHTAIDPWAVVIHLRDTSVTYPAVMGARRFVGFATHTVLVVLRLSWNPRLRYPA